MPKWLKLVLAGVVGIAAVIVALFILLIIIVAIASPTPTPPGTTTPTGGPPTPNYTTKAKSPTGGKDQVVYVGLPAELSDRKLTVSEVEYNYPAPNQFQHPKDGNQFVRLWLTLENTGDHQFDYNPLNFKLQDSTGVQKSNEFLTELPYSMEHGSLAPGGTLQANLVYEAPPGDTDLKFVYEPFDKSRVGTATMLLGG